jgi:hypothetical protein
MERASLASWSSVCWWRFSLELFFFFGGVLGGNTFSAMGALAFGGAFTLFFFFFFDRATDLFAAMGTLAFGGSRAFFFLVVFVFLGVSFNLNLVVKLISFFNESNEAW